MTITLETLTALLEMLEEVSDVTIWDCGEVVRVTIEDFEGFDESWREVDREYERPDLVSELEDILGEFATGDYYQTIEIGGRCFRFGYSSFDI